MFVKFPVLNEDKLREVNEEQPLNISSIFITFCVLNDFKSNDFNPLQAQNIAYISVTFSVLNEVKSSVVKEEHPFEPNS